MQTVTSHGSTFVFLGRGDAKLPLIHKYKIREEDLWSSPDDDDSNLSYGWKGNDPDSRYFVRGDLYYDIILGRENKPMKIGDMRKVPTDFVYVGTKDTTNIHAIRDLATVWFIDEEGDAVEETYISYDREYFVLFDDFLKVSHLIKKPTIRLPESIISEEGEFVFIGFGNEDTPLDERYNLPCEEIWSGHYHGDGISNGYYGAESDDKYYVRKQYYIDNIEKFQNN